MVLGGNNIRGEARGSFATKADSQAAIQAETNKVFKNYDSLMQIISERPNVVVLISGLIPSPATSSFTQPHFAFFQMQLARLARKHNGNQPQGRIILLDINRLFLNISKVPDLKTGPNATKTVFGEKLELFEKDQIHLNPIGADLLLKISLLSLCVLLTII